MRRTRSLRLSLAGVLALAALATAASASPAGTSAFSASPASLAFGDVPVGGSATLPLTLTNNSGQPMWFNGTFKGGPDRDAWSASFSIASGGCPGFGGLMPGSSCDLPVTFAPLKKGKHRSTLLLDDGLGDSLSILVTGTGT